MTIKIPETLKHALISILIGAAVAFATSLIEGLLRLIQSGSFDVSGGLVTSLWYLKRIRAKV